MGGKLVRMRFSLKLFPAYVECGAVLRKLRGHAEEFKPYGIAVNGLWPRTLIATAALQMIPGIKPEHCRTSDILADAAALILQLPVTKTGNFYIDDEVLAAHGVTDLEKYSLVPGSRQLMPDLFL